MFAVLNHCSLQTWTSHTRCQPSHIKASSTQTYCESTKRVNEKLLMDEIKILQWNICKLNSLTCVNNQPTHQSNLSDRHGQSYSDVQNSCGQLLQVSHDIKSLCEVSWLFCTISKPLHQNAQPSDLGIDIIHHPHARHILYIKICLNILLCVYFLL